MESEKHMNNQCMETQHLTTNKQNYCALINSVFCQFGNNVKSVCIQKQCQHGALMCNEEKGSCKCKMLHQNCFTTQFNKFTKKIQKKVLNTDKYVEVHDKIVQNFIDKIIEIASSVKEKFKSVFEQKYTLFLLNQNEKELIKNIQNKNLKNFKGQYYCKLINYKMLSAQIQSKMRKIENKMKLIQATWKNLQTNVQNQLKNLQRYIEADEIPIFPQQYLQMNFQVRTSKIVESQDQALILKSFFDKKIKKYELLYRASQHQFKLDNFYENCTNIPNTLTIIQTEFGKKIGGFTPLCWKKVQLDEKISDKTNSSFIFSLTNNEKFKQKDLNSGIKNTKNYGPYFSHSSADIKLKNEANLNDCRGDFNHEYIHQNYKQRNGETHKRFSGNPNNQNKFKAKQWEVYKIQFDQ